MAVDNATIGPPHDLTSFQRDLLYVVADLDDPHGLAVKDKIARYYEGEIHHGRLYPNLDTLVEKGLITKSQKDERTNEYALASRGRRLLESKHAWERDCYSGEESDDE